MKYKQAHLGNIDGYDIYLVDGRIVRNTIFIDFTVGGSTNIYYWIPENEILIDSNVPKEERPIFIKRFIMLENACKKGKNAAEVLLEIYKKESIYRKKISPTKRVNPKFSTKIGSISIYLVSGRDVRDHLDVEFCCAGNDCAYSYLPKETLWFDTDFSKELIPLLFHEMVERNKVLDHENYFQAHEESNAQGLLFLDEPGKMREILLNEFKKSTDYSNKGIHTSSKHYHSMTQKFD